jgi:hypothetical protein
MRGREIMSRAKSLLTTLLAAAAALALSALLAGPASAGWFIEGAELGSGHSAALASLPGVDENIILNTPTLGIKVSCKGAIHITNGRIAEPETTYADKIMFLDCKTVAPTPTKCNLNEGGSKLISITTRPVLALAAEGSSFPQGRLTLKPETGKVLVEIPFEEGTGCVIEGSQPIKGSVTLNAPTLQEEHVTQPVEGLGSIENNSLELGTSKAYLENGKTLLQLASGKAVAFNSCLITCPKPMCECKNVGFPNGEWMNSTCTTHGPGEWECKKKKPIRADAKYAIIGDYARRDGFDITTIEQPVF